MPAGMVRPLASQAPRLSPEAVADYIAHGWTLTEHGHVCSGSTVGPCAGCHQPHERYGPNGRTHCTTCRPALEAAA